VLNPPKPSIYQTNQDPNQVNLLRECWYGCDDLKLKCYIQQIQKIWESRASLRDQSEPLPSKTGNISPNLCEHLPTQEMTQQITAHVQQNVMRCICQKHRKMMPQCCPMSHLRNPNPHCALLTPSLVIYICLLGGG
jgi:hypothetical protein